jgi:glycosyltransferase involved in cell wall biosynthesis
VFSSARVAVFPSYTETFGFTAFEAMSRGCPTIYTRRPPGPELVEDGVQGLLVDPDDPTEIADAILRLLKDNELARRLSSNGRALVNERFSLETVLPQNLYFYETCISRFQGGSNQ